MSDGTELANLILDHINSKSTKRGDGKYYPRTSAVGRCIRDMTMHKYGEPWSDPPQAMWGTQFRFDVGHASLLSPMTCLWLPLVSGT